MSVQISRTVAVTTVACLVFSLAIHIANVVTLWRSCQCPFDGGQLAGVEELPLSLKPALLTTHTSPRLGMYANDSAIMPSGYGFIYDEDRDAHLMVAHFHQLHCLHVFRTALLKHGNLTRGHLSHVDHCFMYLHQIILCNADPTLEPATHKQKTHDGKIVNAVTGFNVTHRCKDWGQLRDYMEDNYAQWSSTYGGGDDMMKRAGWKSMHDKE
ncbi:hypothetical protein ACG7TL_002860 [Trametes sanguinea]